MLLFWKNERRETFIFTHPTVVNQELSVKVDTIKLDGDWLTFTGGMSQGNVKCGVKITSEKEKEWWSGAGSGIVLKVDGELSLGESQRNLDGFDYRKYLKQNGFLGVLTITKIKKITQKRELSLNVLRRNAIVHSEKRFSKQMKELVTGLLFAHFSKDFDENRELFQSLGLLHLFAISGLHISLFLHYFRRILLRIGLTKEVVLFLQVVFSIFYLGMTGFATSVWRAVLQRNSGDLFGLSPQNAFGLTVGISVIFNPYLFFTASGQLTFGLAFLIAFLTPALERFRGLKKEVIFTISLSFGILPLLSWNFYEWNVSSIVLSFFLTKVFECFFLPMIVVLFFTSFVFELKWLNVSFDFLAPFTELKLIIGKPNIVLFFALLALTIFLIWIIETGRWRYFFLYFVMISGVFFFQTHHLTTMVAMVDIGQGDSFFIQPSVSTTATLIDVGGKREIVSNEKWKERKTSNNAEKTLIPFLKSRGVQALEVFISHAHEDHYGDVLTVNQAVPIKTLYYPKGAEKQAGFRKILLSLEQTGTRIHPVLAPEKIGEMEVLFPKEEVNDGGNNDSLILRQTIGGRSFLFTGDAESEEEQLLLLEQANITADVLKVGHHGSKTSSTEEFLDKISPKIALISCGVNNSFRHPNQETLEKLGKRNIFIKRTDENGMIYFTVDPFSATLGNIKSVRENVREK